MLSRAFATLSPVSFLLFAAALTLMCGGCSSNGNPGGGTTVVVCGNGVCEVGEGPAVCPQDCTSGGGGVDAGSTGGDTSGPEDAGGGDTGSTVDAGPQDAGGQGDTGAGTDAGVGGDEPAESNLVSNGTKKSPAKTASWTWLVYLHADNNLEPAALGDLQEMAAVGSGPTLNIVVQIDRAEGYTNDGVLNLPAFEDAKRLLIKKGEIQVLQEMGELDRDNPNEVSDFVKWGLQHYPADRTALIFWNHGGGVGGFGGDESHTHETIKIAPLAEAVATGMAQAQVDRLDLIGFDACLMATWEVAAAFAPLADHLLASEELEPGFGWNYKSLQLIKNDPGASVTELGQKIADDFLAYGVAAGDEAIITLSLIDLTALGPLDAAIADVAASAWDDVAIAVPAIAKARGKSLDFGRAGPGPHQAGAHVDLGVLTAAMAAQGAVEPQIKAGLDAALAAAVLVNVRGSKTQAATGLSVHFPSAAADLAPGYASLPGMAPWGSFLQAYFFGASQGGGVANYTGSVGFTSSDADVTETANGVLVSGTLTPGSLDALVDAQAVGGYASEDGVVLLLSGPADIDEAAGKVSVEWGGEYLAIQTGSNAYAPLYAEFEPLDDGTEDVLVSTFFDLQSATGPATVMISAVLTDTGFTDQMWFRIEDNGQIGAYFPWQGDLLTPLVMTIDDNDEPVFEPSGNGVDPFAAGELVIIEAPAGGQGFVLLSAQGVKPENTEYAIGLFAVASNGPVCGDGVCDAGEDQTSCPADCGFVGPYCGDGQCTAGESPANCGLDCSAAGPVCGDAVCELGETDLTCPLDCAVICGDGFCDGGETDQTCPADCALVSFCGDLFCDPVTGENEVSCPFDCAPAGPVCGDGNCDANESSASCPADCGPAGPVCGDGACEAGESANSCPADCFVPPANSCAGLCGFETGGACNCDLACKDFDDCCPDYDALCGGGLSCEEQWCSPQIASCAASDDCLFVMACLDGCLNDACAVGCLSAVDAATQAIVESVVDCVVLNCP